MRISPPTATAAALILVIAGLTPQAPAAIKADAKTPHTAPAAQALSVQVHVSTSHALQFHGVRFKAQPSAHDISLYVFVYGDGIVDYSSQPVTMHGYRKAGTYHARVGVLDSTGQTAVSAPVTILVRDGLPPVVRIDQPSPGQHVRLGSAGIRFTGSVHDADGVKQVQLAIQLLSSSTHFNTRGGCIWYDGHNWLVLSSCSNPHFFNVPFGHGQWSFRMSPQVRIPAGSYVVRVRATDRAGNISSYYAISLRTILPFELAR